MSSLVTIDGRPTADSVANVLSSLTDAETRWLFHPTSRVPVRHPRSYRAFQPTYSQWTIELGWQQAKDRRIAKVTIVKAERQLKYWDAAYPISTSITYASSAQPGPMRMNQPG